VVRVGDRVRTGLDPRGLEPASEEFRGRCPELAEAFLEVRAGWLLDFAIGVGVSGGLGRLSFRRVRVGVSGVGGEEEDVVRSSRVGLDGVEPEG
jgi:hypothetical protein